MYERRTRDAGSVLVLTLILVTVMAVVVVALASYVTVGLKTSDVASERTETNADAANVMNWAIEQFAKKQLRPDDDCGEAPGYLPIVSPGGLASNGSSTTLQCAQTTPITGEPVVHLVARSIGDQTRVIETTVEVPRYSHGARVSDWRVDIPIEVPEYVTTTTVASGTTTTTTIANVAPTANVTSWVVNEGVSTMYLDATDSDGTIASAVVNSLPVGWVADNSAGGRVIELTAAGVGTYTMSYVVTDDDGATATNALHVEVTLDPTTTTTTTTIAPVPPMPSCTFVVTSAHQNGKSGSGTLTVSNSGSDFTGWQIRLTQKNSSHPWQFTWGDPSLSVTPGSSHVTVAGSQMVTQTTPFTVTADLTQSSNGAPATAKIDVNDSLTCQVLSPA